MKKVLRILLGAAFSIAFSTAAFAGVWKQDSLGWWYDNQDGTWLSNGWSWLDGNNDGIAECYYFNPHGSLLTGTVTPDGYTVNTDGQWVKGSQIMTQPTSELDYVYDASSRVYAWMNGLYKTEDGCTINLDAAGGNQVAAQFYCYSEDGWNISYLSGQVDENTHALYINDYFDLNGQPTAYHQLNIDGDATVIWVQTYSMDGTHVGSWYEGWYYKK